MSRAVLLLASVLLDLSVPVKQESTNLFPKIKGALGNEISSLPVFCVVSEHVSVTYPGIQWPLS